MQRDIPRGVAGMGARQDVGVVATVGTRGPNGNPVLRHSWFLMDPLATPVDFDKLRNAPTRQAHPSFTDWNRAAREAAKAAAAAQKNRARPDPNPYAILRGNLVHGDWRAASAVHFRAQQLRGTQADGKTPWTRPASRRPCCEGDGVDANRYFGKAADGGEDWRQVPCPGLLCPFQQEQGGKRDCGPFAMLFFRLRWPPGQPFPSLLCRLQTGSYQSVESLLGLFEGILGTAAVRPWVDEADRKPGLAAELGVASPSLLGLPFSVEIGWKSNPDKQRVYPVLTFSPDEDLFSWLTWQQEQRRLAGGALRALGPAPEPLPVVTPEIVDAAYTEVAAQGVPAEIVGAAGEERRERAPEPARGGAQAATAPGRGGTKATAEPGGGGATGAEQATLDLPLTGHRVTLNGAQVQAIREEAQSLGVSWDAFEGGFAGGPLAEYLGEPGETEKTLELRVLRELRERVGKGGAA